MFETDRRYKRAEVQELLGVPEAQRDGNWDTGYNAFGGALYIFCNVGSAGRTGHDYPNRWDGDELIWFAKSRTHVSHPSMRSIISGQTPVHVFWREKSNDPHFSYSGIARIVSVVDETPVQFRFAFGATSTLPAQPQPQPQPQPQARQTLRSPTSSDGHVVAVRPSDPDVRRVLSNLAIGIQQRIQSSEQARIGSHPLRKGPDLGPLIEALNDKWGQQKGCCALCGQAMQLKPANRLLQPSGDRIDSAEKSYEASNLHLTHLGCNLAKSSATLEQWSEFLAMIRGKET